MLRGTSVVRVKIWDRSGRIVYSDEPGLIGARYPIAPEELKEFEGTRIDAEVSDLSKPENRFEREFGKLLEVYAALRPRAGSISVTRSTTGRASSRRAAQRIFREFGLVVPRRADPAGAHPASARVAGWPSEFGAASASA